MANTLLIEKEDGGYFGFTLTIDGEVFPKVRNMRNDAFAIDTICHFKTANGANIIKTQNISVFDITLIASGTFTFTDIDVFLQKLIEVGYWDWMLGGGGGGVTRFDQLDDTFEYYGQNGKVVVVNESELKLEAVTFYNYNKFTQLSDTPNSISPNKIVVTNAEGTALEYADKPTIIPPSLASVGSFHYADVATGITPITILPNTPIKLTNDGDGVLTILTNNPYGVSNVWDSTLNQFNFSQLSIGDLLAIRPNIEITTTIASQNFRLSLKLGIGSPSEFTLPFGQETIKDIGTKEFTFLIKLDIAYADILNSPAEIIFESDDDAQVTVIGWYIDIIRKSINIIDVNVNYIDHYKGVYPTLSALNSAHPTADAGDYAQVNEVGATDVVNYNWDAEESIWVEGGSGSPIDVSGKEDKSNKTDDVAGSANPTQEYPSVQGLINYLSSTGTVFTKIVYVNSTNPNTATIFDTENPPVTNDNSLKADVNNLYIATDGTSWIYNTTSSNYTTIASTSALSNFYFADTTTDAGGNKTVAIYRLGKIGIGGSPKAGKFEVLIDGVYSTNVALVPNGTIGFGNDSGSTMTPTIYGRSNDSTGLMMMAATNDVNITDDMRWDVRENNNTDFSVLTSIAYRWTRFNVTLFKVFRNGIFNIPILSGAGVRSIAANSNGDLVIDVKQITITTSVSITTDTLGDVGNTQFGRHVLIKNGVNNINITINGVDSLPTTYQKEGTGTITFVQGSGRTLRQASGTAIMNGAVGSTATITSDGTLDSLLISNN